MRQHDWGSVLSLEAHSLRPRHRSATSLKEGGNGAVRHFKHTDKLEFVVFRQNDQKQDGKTVCVFVR